MRGKGIGKDQRKNHSMQKLNRLQAKLLQRNQIFTPPSCKLHGKDMDIQLPCKPKLDKIKLQTHRKIVACKLKTPYGFHGTFQDNMQRPPYPCKDQKLTKPHSTLKKRYPQHARTKKKDSMQNSCKEDQTFPSHFSISKTRPNDYVNSC